MKIQPSRTICYAGAFLVLVSLARVVSIALLPTDVMQRWEGGGLFVIGMRVLPWVAGLGLLLLSTGIIVRTKHRPVLLSVTICLTICLFTAGAFLWQPTWLFHWSDFRTGNRIITQVEAFRQSHGHLPETLEEVGITDPNPRVFYRKTDEHEYVVWFGISVGESETYDSSTRKWE